MYLNSALFILFRVQQRESLYMVKYKVESEFALIMPQKFLLNLSKKEAHYVVFGIDVQKGNCGSGLHTTGQTGQPVRG